MIKQFLSEDSGRLSSIRIAQLSVVALFCLNWIVDIIRGVIFSPHWSVVGIIAGIVGAKVVQKKFEQKVK